MLTTHLADAIETLPAPVIRFLQQRYNIISTAPAAPDSFCAPCKQAASSSSSSRSL
jgi:hypothetical protein